LSKSVKQLIYGKTTFIENILYASVTENIFSEKAVEICHESYKHSSAYQSLFVIEYEEKNNLFVYQLNNILCDLYISYKMN
jgi:hypothetical protein